MTRAYVLHLDLPAGADAELAVERRSEARLAEAVGLAEALDLDIIGSEIIAISKPRVATLIGTGAVGRLAELFKVGEVELAIVDAQLSPIQQRNLEKEWKVKVLDRTGLILEIFGDRAQTREGVLQVELAHFEYQKSRLVRSWTHLERQRGGAGFMGGPGETQIESDRRILSEKILRLKRRLEKAARTRALHRSARMRAPYPVIALVGYTNAGKSTLFNRLTEARVLAKDMLFATLDPTMRAIALPNGGKAIMSDTVGFISNLPTQLVAAFRATLEEVSAADVIVHVRDIADPETDAQREDVLGVLEELGVDEAAREKVLEAHNKIDLLSDSDRLAALNAAKRDSNAVCVSAHTGDGVERLLAEIERRVTSDARNFEIELSPTEGAALAWLYEHGCVRGRRDMDELIRLRLRMGDLELGKFEKRFGPVRTPSELAAAE